jgi:hypothetical protein
VEWPSELSYYSWCHHCYQNASSQYFLYLREQKDVTGGQIRWIGGCSSTVICLLAKNSLTDSALIQAPTFSRRHTKTHSDNNRSHSERDCHRSTTTQLWNVDMPTSLNHTEDSVHCCHVKHTVESSRALLPHFVPSIGKRNEEETSSAFNVVAITVYVLHNLTRLYKCQERYCIAQLAR